VRSQPRPFTLAKVLAPELGSIKRKKVTLIRMLSLIGLTHSYLFRNIVRLDYLQSVDQAAAPSSTPLLPKALTSFAVDPDVSFSAQ